MGGYLLKQHCMQMDQRHTLRLEIIAGLTGLTFIVEKIKIGKNCVIAAGVNILDSNGHELISTNRTNHQADTPKDIIIKENVWIGLNSVILKGTIIGNNCVIGANSVVKGVFEDNSLIQGNPAVLISKLPINS